MFPCPGLAPFLPFEVVLAIVFSFFGSGSSSEKDSQTCSSFVTVQGQRAKKFHAAQKVITEVSLLIFDCLLLRHTPPSSPPASCDSHSSLWLIYLLRLRLFIKWSTSWFFFCFSRSVIHGYIICCNRISIRLGSRLLDLHTILHHLPQFFFALSAGLACSVTLFF